MEQLTILFGSIREIEQFVRITTRLQGSVRVSSGEQVMDGKAIMGLMSLGLYRKLTMVYEGTREEFLAFRDSIQSYLAAG